ncbi:SPFH domain-containing protein [Treponema phagedenis]|uniref:SPFH domain-containing protein n=1 Tax=Treponema phagedenis TaxID=162 RepID=UPI0001F64100|nr:SPFH domain-containing protein [Treponema phagedenis]EFW37848.1 hypothetical protein HMPREF9554_01658 [Treponema phagedenis F0421]TYT79693.1 hypothetical protein FS559_11765 [Treponema phagedenis]
MKGKTKFFITLIILVGVSSAVFIAGWLQFSVPAGKYGILLSRSSGYYQKVIMPGQFLWRWERLIPTNAKVLIFDLQRQNILTTVTDTLPSAAQYQAILEKKADFSWKITVSSDVRLKPEKLLNVIEHENITDQAGLDSYIRTKIEALQRQAAYNLISSYLENNEMYEAMKTQYGKISHQIKKEITSDILEIESVWVQDITIPDMALYKSVVNTYNIYEQKRSELLAELAAENAKHAANEELQLQRMTKWGEFLKRYPSIIEFLAVARDDAQSTLNTLKSVQNTDQKNNQDSKNTP